MIFTHTRLQLFPAEIRNVRRTLILGTLLSTPFLLSVSAEAACTGSPTNQICSGPMTSQLNVTNYAAPMTLTLASDFSLTPGLPTWGIFLRGTGGTTLTQAAGAGLIEASENAVWAEETGSGMLTIDITGSVVSSTRTGIDAFVATTGTDLSVKTHNVTGAIGISAKNEGTGNVAIDTTAGTITATDTYGIFAKTGGTAKNLSVKSGKVDAKTKGIYAEHIGTGTVTIDTTGGDVTADTSDGVLVEVKNSAAGNVDLLLGNVTGGTDGVNVVNGGSGFTKIKATGLLKSSSAANTQMGLRVYGGTFTTGISLDVVDTSSKSDAMTARLVGTGNLDVISRGTATALTGTGISLVTGKFVDGALSSVTSDAMTLTANNATGQTGIDMDHLGTGLLTANITGTVTGTLGQGLVARSTRAGATINIASWATVLGDGTGIRASLLGAGDLRVTSQGTVVGQKSNGMHLDTNVVSGSMSVTAKDVTGAMWGIELEHFGTGLLTANITGTVTGIANEGILATSEHADATISVATGATVTGATRGINLDTVANDGTLVNRGTVTGATGVYIASTGSTLIENHGTITGTNYAIQGDEGMETVNALGGNINGLVDLGGGDDVFNGVGGALNGSLEMGSGNDTTNLRGGFILGTDVAHLDGGVDSDTLNLDNFSLRGYTSVMGSVSPGVILTGWENINVKNGGQLKLSGNLFEPENTGTVLIDNSSTLDLKGNSPGVFTIFGNVNNTGLMTFQDDAADDVTTITDNYNGGAGSTIELDTFLGGDDSATDRLVIKGDASGNTGLLINPVGGTGEKTNLGIKVVQVDGTAIAGKDAFKLANADPLEIGAYVYDLTYYGGADQNFYLTNTVQKSTPGSPGKPVIGSIGAVYEAGSTTALDTMRSGSATLEQRVGQRQLVRGKTSGKSQIFEGMWMRGIGGMTKLAPRRSDADLKFRNWTGGTQVGVDVLGPVMNDGTFAGDVVFGVAGTYLSGSADVHNPIGKGHVHNDVWGGGLTATWYGANGLYADAQAGVASVEQRYNTQNHGSLKKHVNRTGWMLSQEAGYRYGLDEHNRLVPQAQISWGQVDAKSMTDKMGNDVRFRSASGTLLRVGMAWEYLFAGAPTAAEFGNYRKAYVIGNVLHDFGTKSKVDVSGAKLSERDNRTWAEIGLGGTIGFDESKALFAEGRYRTKISGHGTAHGLGMTGGFRLTW